jgi:hypothetical protein
LKHLPDNVSEVSMYSDCCSWQNHHIPVAVIPLTAVQELEENEIYLSKSTIHSLKLGIII